MSNCFCDGVYGSGVWTAGIKNDFDYRNNVITNCNTSGPTGRGIALADAGGRGGRQGAASPAAPRELTHYKVVDSFSLPTGGLPVRAREPGSNMRIWIRRSSNCRDKGDGPTDRLRARPDETELLASGRRIGSGPNRCRPFPEAYGVTSIRVVGSMGNWIVQGIGKQSGAF